MKKLFKSRFSLLFSTAGLYLGLSFLTRLVLLIWSFQDVNVNFVWIAKAFLTGFAFDLCIATMFLFLYALYLFIFPKRWIGSLADRIFTYFYLTVLLIIIYFSVMAEYPFWEEFGVRFNFIAVDYLIYTYEVVSNINESYPIALIVLVLVALIAGTLVLFSKKNIFEATFTDKRPILNRAFIAIPIMLLGVLLLTTLKNKQADSTSNLVVNELGKNGAFSFFAAFRSNELDYATFYPTLEDKEAYSILKESLLQNNQAYSSKAYDDIERITNGQTQSRPNIILIAIESFSADFLTEFGNEKNLTPNYDKLASESQFFTNLYATGTRTVRGMEALTLSVPPTPGNSIVRRPSNENLYSVASIIQAKNYHPYFIYGGDGYFDNMNTFFGGQGFDIVDRDRGNPLSDKIKTKRYAIPDSEVSFENAWGICDEDLYNQSLRYADKSASSGKPFFQFVMTTSNHRPYTFPEGKIDLPQGDRDAAVKYTDYALGKFIEKAKTRSWFKNTVFVIVADHCASSAGKWEINIDKHHIPAIIYNLPQPPQKINRLTSQIDLMPTLFGYLNWSYKTSLYGKDLWQTKVGQERAFIGNYRTLGILKNNVFTQIDDRRRVKQFQVSQKDASMQELKIIDPSLVQQTISYYQTASERFKNGKMKKRPVNPQSALLNKSKIK